MIQRIRIRRLGTQGFQAGFTLVELLCVVSLIAILAAATLPKFNKIRHQARVGTFIKELRCVELSYASSGNASILNGTAEFLSGVNASACRLSTNPPRVELDYYWCIRFLPDGSPYLTQCIEGLPAEDYMLGIRVPGLIDPETGEDQQITVSSFDGVRARTAPPTIPNLP